MLQIMFPVSGKNKHQILEEISPSPDTIIYGQQGKFWKTVEETKIVLKSPSEREATPYIQKSCGLSEHWL